MHEALNSKIIDWLAQYEDNLSGACLAVDCCYSQLTLYKFS